MGSLGGIGMGLRAAALPAAGYAAAFGAISHVGEQMYQGAQNLSQVGGMAQQYMGPQYGEAGQRPGGKMARGQIQQLTSVLHEIAGEETMASMKDVVQLMDRAGQMGMLTGIQSSTQFRDKFRRVVDQAKTVAEVMGSTIEEGMGALSGFQKMGLWSTQDVMGASQAMKQAGPQGAPQLVGAMQLGAARSHAMGGSLASGAKLAQAQFQNISSAVREGVLPPEMVQELTGGVGGVEGQAMLANRMTGALQSMTQTPLGRLAMAGLAETKDGKYTGRIDQEKLSRFKRGDISIGQLQQMGSKASSTRAGAASFTYKQEQIGQDMMSKGGLELSSAMFEKALDKAQLGGADEETRGLFLQKVYGLKRRDAMLAQKMFKNLSTIQERNSRRDLDSIQDQFRRVEERQNRSWEGLKDVLANAFEEGTERPIQEFAEKLATTWNEQADKVTDSIYGRVRQANQTRQERMRQVLSAPSTPGGKERLQTGMDRYSKSSLLSTYGETGAIERMRNAGVGGAAWGALNSTGAGTKAQGLISSGAEAVFGGEGVPVAGGKVIPFAEVRRTVSNIRRRAGSPTLNKMFEKSDITNEAYAAIRTAYQSVRTPEFIARAKKAKAEMSATEYQQWYLDEFNKSAAGKSKMVEDSFRDMAGGTTADTTSLKNVKLDVLAVMQQEDNDTTDVDRIEHGDIARETGVQLEAHLMDGAAFSKEIDSRVSESLSLLEGKTSVTGGLGGGLLGGVRKTTERDLGGLSETRLRTMLTEEGPLSDELRKYIQSTDKVVNPKEYPNLAKRQGEKGISEVLVAVGNMPAKDRGALGKTVGSGEGEDALGLSELLQSKASREDMNEIGRLAGGELGDIKGAGPAGLKGLLTKLQGAATSGSLTELDEAKADIKARAKEISEMPAREGRRAINALKESAGPIAEHLADMAEIESLDAKKLGKLSGVKLKRELDRRGLGDELSKIGTLNPELGSAMDDVFSSKKRVGKENVQALIEELKKFEPTDMAGGVAARDKLQVEANNALRGFVAENSKFVLAVSAAVPLLSKVNLGNIEETKKRLQQESGTNPKKDTP
jgi:hypothetical protein